MGGAKWGGGITYPLNATGAINETSATLASASTVNIGAAAANAILITGTLQQLQRLILYNRGRKNPHNFAGALTPTHNGTSLILPTGPISPRQQGCSSYAKPWKRELAGCVSYQGRMGRHWLVAASLNSRANISESKPERLWLLIH